MVVPAKLPACIVVVALRAGEVELAAALAEQRLALAAGRLPAAGRACNGMPRDWCATKAVSASIGALPAAAAACPAVPRGTGRCGRPGRSALGRRVERRIARRDAAHGSRPCGRTRSRPAPHTASPSCHLQHAGIGQVVALHRLQLRRHRLEAASARVGAQRQRRQRTRPPGASCHRQRDASRSGRSRCRLPR